MASWRIGRESRLQKFKQAVSFEYALDYGLCGAIACSTVIWVEEQDNDKGNTYKAMRVR